MGVEPYGRQNSDGLLQYSLLVPILIEVIDELNVLKEIKIRPNIFEFYTP